MKVKFIDSAQPSHFPNVFNFFAEKNFLSFVNCFFRPIVIK